MGSEPFGLDDLELLSLLLGQEEGLTGPPRTIPTRPDPEERPLSFAQQRLWFFEQLNPGSNTYNNLWAVSLTGQLSVPALERSISEIVRRHEVLRIAFATVQGEPRQVVAPAAPVPLPISDLRPLTPTEADAEVQRILMAEVSHPFDLSEGPLWRVVLLRLAEERWILILTMHHITSDGWSMDVLGQEMAALYSAFVLGQPSPLPELPIQYADFAHWQRQRVQGTFLDEQVAYWKAQLRDLPTLNLPLDFPRPEVQSYRGANQPLELSPAVTEQLKAVGQAHGGTLFMVLLTALTTLMHYTSGQEDIVVGTDVANRDQSEVEGLIGFFVNQLALRTSLAGNPTFAELLERVREAARAAYMHQDIPFEQVIQALNLPRSLKVAPLFQVKLFLQHALPAESTLPGLTLRTLPFDPGIARLDLVLGLWESPEGIMGWLNYNSDLFTPATVAQMADQLTTLLTHIAAHPDTPLGDLVALLREREETVRQAERQRREEAKRDKFKKGSRRRTADDVMEQQ